MDGILCFEDSVAYAVNDKSYVGENLCGFHVFLQTAKLFPTNFINAIECQSIHEKSCQK